MADYLDCRTPGADRYYVYLNGELQTNVLQARAGDNGMVVLGVFTPDDKPLLDAQGQVLKKVLNGKVEFREKIFVRL